MKAQGGAIFGGLEKLREKDGGLSVTWRLGFLKSVRVAREQYDSDLDVAATLTTLLALPIAAHLDSLSVGLCEEPGDGSLQPAIDALVQAAGPQTLRSLFLGDFEYPDQSDISSTSKSWSLRSARTGLRQGRYSRAPTSKRPEPAVFV